MPSLGAGQAKSERDLRAGLSDVSYGLVIDVDDTTSPPLALVSLGGGQGAWMPYVGPRPWEGEQAQVATLGQKMVCLGATYGHPLGAIQTVGSGIASILGDDGKTYRYPYPTGESFTAGNRVVMDHSLRTVLHELSTEPPGSEWTPPAGPPGGGSGGSASFGPAWSAHYRGGVYQNPYVTISDTRAGFYGYGTQIADTIPDGATITRADLVLTQNWDEVPGTASLMGTHSHPGGAPGSAPGLSGSYAILGGSRAVDLRGAVADALKTGTAFGIGFYAGNGWREYDVAPASGVIHMTWT